MGEISALMSVWMRILKCLLLVDLGILVLVLFLGRTVGVLNFVLEFVVATLGN